MNFCNNNRELSIKILQIIKKFKIINDARQGYLDTRKVFFDMFLDKFQALAKPFQHFH